MFACMCAYGCCMRSCMCVPLAVPEECLPLWMGVAFQSESVSEARLLYIILLVWSENKNFEF